MNIFAPFKSRAVAKTNPVVSRLLKTASGRDMLDHFVGPDGKIYRKSSDMDPYEIVDLRPLTTNVKTTNT